MVLILILGSQPLKMIIKNNCARCLSMSHILKIKALSHLTNHRLPWHSWSKEKKHKQTNKPVGCLQLWLKYWSQGSNLSQGKINSPTQLQNLAWEHPLPPSIFQYFILFNWEKPILSVRLTPILTNKELLSNFFIVYILKSGIKRELIHLSTPVKRWDTCLPLFHNGEQGYCIDDCVT